MREVSADIRNAYKEGKGRLTVRQALFIIRQVHFVMN